MQVQAAYRVGRGSIALRAALLSRLSDQISLVNVQHPHRRAAAQSHVAQAAFIIFTISGCTVVCHCYKHAAQQ